MVGTKESIKHHGSWVLSCSQGWFPNEGGHGNGAYLPFSAAWKQAGKTDGSGASEG